ncbi:MAG: pyrroloquinoline quinone biosynthesis protein PqqB [Rhodospirillales bacterium]
MRIIVLGSAAGGGFPQWNCNCPACRRAREGEAGILSRTQSSVAISADGANWFLLNASPDIRQQLAQTPALQPGRGLRHSPVAGVVLTNADVDHVAGLLSLREGQALTLYATPRVHRVLAANPIFGVLNPQVVARLPLALEMETELALPDGTAAGLRVTAIAVPGKVALWLEDASRDDFGSVAEDSIGLRVLDPLTGGTLWYLPGCADMPFDLAARLDGSDLLLFDGTTWIDDEMLRTGVGSKTGRRMGHMSMSGAGGSIAALAGLAIGRRVFIHINNTNPVLLPDSTERTKAAAAGWEIAWDGMEMAL